MLGQINNDVLIRRYFSPVKPQPRGNSMTIYNILNSLLVEKRDQDYFSPRKTVSEIFKPHKRRHIFK